MRNIILYITAGSIILLSAAGLFMVGKRMFAVQHDINAYEVLLEKDYQVSLVRRQNTSEQEISELPIQDDEPKQLEPQIEAPEQELVEVEFPPVVNLAVPFTSQAPEGNWDQPWQDACEEAAVLMLDAYYKGYGLSPLFAKDELLKMVAWEENKGWGGSINIEKIVELTNFYIGKTPVIKENPSIDDIKQSVANGNPVLVVANGKKLPNPYFSGDGPVYHALIVRGYTEDSFITNDPGTRNGEAFKYKYNDLMAAIGDWNDGDVENGRLVVLMME